VSLAIRTVTLHNSAGMRVTLMNLGARLISIKVPVKGELTEMLLAYPNLNDYLDDSFYVGAVCGPVCNRISNAQFSLAEVNYQLDANAGDHCLHGGDNGLSQRAWQIERHTDQEVVFTLQSSQHDDGFPGNRCFTVSYRLTDDNSLQIDLQGQSDQMTPINLTLHPYFTLGDSTAENLSLTLNSSSFLARTDDGIPTGDIIPASALGQDISSGVVVKALIANSQYPQIMSDSGIDHCFIVDQAGPNKLGAVLKSSTNGVTLRLYSNQPALQVYSGGFLKQPFSPSQGICLEPQAYVDAPNQPDFPPIFVQTGQEYRHNTILQFSIRPK
jgi:aldose 1-epimerase